MYHIRIDYFDKNLNANQTLFDYDYESKEKVITAVLTPYLEREVFCFAGVLLQSVGKVTVYETEMNILNTKDVANKGAGKAYIYYSQKDVLKKSDYSKDVTRALVEEAQTYIRNIKQTEEIPSKTKEKPALLFISHSSADEEIASNMVKMLRTLGFTNKTLFCSSVPGYDIREGEDIYETLASKFNDYRIFVIFLLSENYYNSAACLNEMGATWVLKAEYSTIVCPEFNIPDMKGAVNPSKMAVILNDPKRVKGKLSQLKDRLINFFELPEVEDDVIWENDRDEFLMTIKKK